MPYFLDPNLLARTQLTPPNVPQREDQKVDLSEQPNTCEGILDAQDTPSSQA